MATRAYRSAKPTTKGNSKARKRPPRRRVAGTLAYTETKPATHLGAVAATITALLTALAAAAKAVVEIFGAMNKNH